MSQIQRLLLIAPSAMTRTPEDHRTDVIVMGAVQHTGLNKLLGTTAEQLLHRAPCSVLAIKPGRML